MPVILALKRSRGDDYHEFSDSKGSMESSRLAYAHAQ